MKIKFIVTMPVGFKEGQIKNLSPTIAMNMIEKGYAIPADEPEVTGPMAEITTDPPSEVPATEVPATEVPVPEPVEPSEYVIPSEKQAEKPAKSQEIKSEKKYK